MCIYNNKKKVSTINNIKRQVITTKAIFPADKEYIVNIQGIINIASFGWLVGWLLLLILLIRDGNRFGSYGRIYIKIKERQKISKKKLQKDDNSDE
jgi:hypothetical protein